MMLICDRVRGNRAYAIKIGNWVSGGFRTVLTSCTFVANLKPIALFFAEIQLLLWWPIPKVIIAERKFFLQCTHCAMFSVYLSVTRIDSIKRSCTQSRSQSTQEAVKQGLSSLQEAVKQGPSSLQEAVKQGPSSLLGKLASKGHPVQSTGSCQAKAVQSAGSCQARAVQSTQEAV